jgi:NAD-dependent dihydropyrimidine dehydrogenase PreA subunit
VIWSQKWKDKIDKIHSKRLEVVMAIQKNKRFAVIDEKHCVGCGSCIKVCPKEAISVPKGIAAKVEVDKCVGCGLCAKVCPATVIEIKMTPKEMTYEA